MADKNPPETTRSRRGLTRRQFLPGAAGVLAAGAAGIAGYELRGQPPTSSTAPDQTTTTTTTTTTTQTQPPTQQPGYHSFVTRPDLRPPILKASDLLPAATTETSPRFIALACGTITHHQDEQSGPLLLDRQGRVIWFKPMPGISHNMKVQSYKGKPVITWWSGHKVSWHGVGTDMIVDDSYQTVKEIKSAGKYRADLHDFVLTSRGTALMTSYFVGQTDLTSLGGPQNGKVWACRVIEMDLASGRIVLDWNSLDHVPATDSYVNYDKSAKDPYRYFHLNSIDELPDGNLLISARNTSALYAVDRHTGAVLWRMGGKHSDFQIASDAQFSWQHHATSHGPSTITLFDNGGFATTPYSKALMLSYDVGSKQVKLIREFLHPARFFSAVLGSVQVLSNGNVLVGWGVQPYYSEHKSDGTMISDTEFPINNRSYRAFLVDWIGHPTDKPAVVAKSNPAGGFVIYVSWNGATEVATWTVLAGQDKTSLQPVGSQPWSDFETTIAVNSKGPAFQVVAHDRNGNELGRSEVV